MNSKTIVLAFGVTLLLIGIVGFFMKPVFGIFAVDTFHNLVHLLSGILAMALAMKSMKGAEIFARVFGVMYGLVGILGFVFSDGKIFGVLTINTADNILHILLALAFLFAGFSKAKSMPETPVASIHPPPAQ